MNWIEYILPFLLFWKQVYHTEKGSDQTLPNPTQDQSIIHWNLAWECVSKDFTIFSLLLFI